MALLPQRLVAPAPGWEAYADVVVIAVGVNDTKNLHTRKRWRRELGGLFDLVAESAPKAEIVYLAMPRLELFPLLPHPLGEVLGRRAKQMGEVSAGLAERHPYAEWS